MQSTPLRFLAAVVATCFLGTAAVLADDPPANSDSASQTAVSYSKDVQPIFSRHCLGCHQGAKQLGSYVMTEFSALLAGGESEQPAIVPGKPEESYLIEQITPVDGHAAMPSEPFSPLSEAEIATITLWITQGAKDDSPSNQGPAYDADHPPVYSAAPAITSIDVSPDGKWIAVAGFHEVLLLRAEDGGREARLVGLSPRINSVRFSPDGKRLAVAGGTPAVRGELQIWEVESKQLLLSRLITYDALAGASWSPDGSKVAFGASDNVVRAVDAQTGQQLLFQGAHEDWVRDTAFTADGKHLISVGRDMSCKLTHVETERFIDNITSITPGALSGGLSSVVAHPQRDEIFVGGADGKAKVFRVFRVSARKIGDNANLVRTFPEMPGRIFSVAMNRDASLLAAASTLDGKSEVRVWKYDFDGTLTDELKKILAKRVADRNAEEKKQVAAYQGNQTTEVYKASVDASVYAICFAPDGSLVVAGTDGRLRRYAADGALATEFAAVPVADQKTVLQADFDAKRWNEMLTQRMENAAEEKAPSPEQVGKLIVEPAEIRLDSPYSYAQLVITAELQDGSTVDVTRLCQIESPPWTTLTARGMVRPVADGSAQLTIRFGQQSQSIGISAS
ncbi:MAG: hypothetical protein MI861_20835, partial [Pirellulales bacterium]|nr:hypothetical protein [Pirellulales bacterium]